MSGAMSSPLMLAMLANGGGGANQMGIDPAYAAALPRLNLAQSLISEGTQTTPVQSSKYGGLARLAQALVGNYALDKATTGLQQAYGAHQAANAADMSNLFGGGGASPAAPAAAPAAQVAAPATQVAPIGGPGAAGGSPSTAYAPLIAYTEQRDNLPPGQLGAALNKETGGEPNPATAVNSKSGAQGVAQILPSTAAQPGYGVAPLPPGGALDPAKAIPFAGDYVAARAKAAGLDMTDPAQAAMAWSLYGGDSSGHYGQQVVTQAGGAPAATPGAPPIGAPSAPAAAAPAADPMARYHALQAAAAKAAVSPYPQDHALAAVYSSAAEQEMTRLENTFTPGPNGVYTNALGKPQFAPTPRMATDVHGNLIAAGGGQPIQTVSPNPSGISGNSPDANAMRTMAEIGPKVVAGTATPQEIASYNVAAQTYQQSKLETTTPGQTVTQVPQRPLPAGMPMPGGAPPSGAAGAPPTFGGTLGTPPAVGGAGNAPGVVVAPNPSAIAGQAQAAAQGTESGKIAANTLPRFVKLGTEAAQGIGTIDSAIGQINAASAGGIPTGYFTPALATAAAAAKNLGIDTSKLGVDPAAVSNIQAANKSLSLTAGSIIRQILGPDSQITEGKLDQFIHATPGLATDPQAIQKILGWARSQFVYNHDMAIDAMGHADPGTGMIPPGWEAQYYKKAGSFGPIYNPLHGEMEQPSGQGPSATMPGVPTPTAPQAAAAPAVPAPGGYREGQRAQGPGGHIMVFRNGAWVGQ